MVAALQNSGDLAHSWRIASPEQFWIGQRFTFALKLIGFRYKLHVHFGLWIPPARRSAAKMVEF